MGSNSGCEAGDEVCEEQRKAHVLLVDDEPANLHLLLAALQDDHQLSVATSGASAMMIVQLEDTPDLILLDVVMPEMDGFEVCRWLKTEPTTRDIPVIFLTALEQAEYESMGLELGAADYITKPFNLDLVRLRVRNHLELKIQRDLLRRQKAELAEALAKVNLLSGLLPICANCKKIRDGQGQWRQVESYIKEHSEASFTHSLCQDCVKSLYPELSEQTTMASEE